MSNPQTGVEPGIMRDMAPPNFGVPFDSLMVNTTANTGVGPTPLLKS